MKKLTTIALTIALMSLAANAAIMPGVSYVPQDIGGGLTLYTFSVDGNEDPAALGSLTTQITFSGTIQQIEAIKYADYSVFGGGNPDRVEQSRIGVNDQTTADAQMALVAEGRTGFPPMWTEYDAGRDSWYYNGWTIEPTLTTSITSVTGADVTLGVTTGAGSQFSSKVLVQIVADGDVEWVGKIGRLGAEYSTSGTATLGSTPGDSETNPIMPDSSEVVDAPLLGPGATSVKHSFVVTEGAVDGRWYDPIMVPAFEYEATVGTFAAVTLPSFDLIADADGYFIDLGVLGQTHVAAGGTFVFESGVTKFWIIDIEGPVDAELGTAFPTFLSFNETSAAFSMTGVPEPATMTLMLFGAIGMIARKKRRS